MNFSHIIFIFEEIFNSDVEDKWKRLRPMANRQYYYSSSQIKIEYEEAEIDATYEQSKSAFFYMFDRVYRQWQEATEMEKQEYESIIDFKNSAKIPRYVTRFFNIYNNNFFLFFFQFYM